MVGVSVTVLLLDISSYGYSFLERIQMGLGVGMVVSIFLLEGGFLIEKKLDCCACMWPLTVDSKFRVYLVTWITVNSGQYLGQPFLIALHQVGIIGENKAPW